MNCIIDSSKGAVWIFLHIEPLTHYRNLSVRFLNHVGDLFSLKTKYWNMLQLDPLFRVSSLNPASLSKLILWKCNP